MTEPQVWVLIGVFATTVFGMITIVMTTFHRTLTLSVEKLEIKIDALDRDIQALSHHVFGTDPRRWPTHHSRLTSHK